MVAVGTIVWLASELMFFAALFAAYFTIRNVTNAPGGGRGAESLWADARRRLLNIPFAIVNTTSWSPAPSPARWASSPPSAARSAGPDRLLQSAAVGAARVVHADLPHGRVLHRRPGLRVRGAVLRGPDLSSNVYGSVFFLATGFHGLHVTGGLIAFVLVLGRTFLARTFTHEQAVSAVVVSYYWHFVDVVWIALFGVIYLLR